MFSEGSKGNIGKRRVKNSTPAGNNKKLTLIKLNVFKVNNKDTRTMSNTVLAHLLSNTNAFDILS